MKESDWRLFRKRVPRWRERYLERVNAEIGALAMSSDRTPTEVFWKIKERVDAEAQILRECLDGHSRSNMRMSLISMYRHGLVDDADLEEFSEELREHVLTLFGDTGG